VRAAFAPYLIARKAAPSLVMADADLGMAVKAVTASRVINSGQVCNCAERIYVQGKISDEFTEKLAAAMQATRCGNPLADEAADYGPLINQAGYNKVEALVRGAVADGATLVTGGQRHELEGGYYADGKHGLNEFTQTHVVYMQRGRGVNRSRPRGYPGRGSD